jgi:FtsZ-binding cell division protein ZapB
MAELKKKIKSTIGQSNSCDGEIRELREHQQELSEQLEYKQIDLQALQSSADTLDGDTDRLQQTKHKV